MCVNSCKVFSKEVRGQLGYGHANFLRSHEDCNVSELGVSATRQPCLPLPLAGLPSRQPCLQRSDHAISTALRRNGSEGVVNKALWIG